jgi:hypothetical protein
MIRIRHTAALVLAAIFWLAQLQGTGHAIGHLVKPTEASSRAVNTHSILCVECVALAQAGAAPLPTLADAASPLVTTTFHSAPDDTSIGAQTPRAYRSRAPPSAPI